RRLAELFAVSGSVCEVRPLSPDVFRRQRAAYARIFLWAKIRRRDHGGDRVRKNAYHQISDVQRAASRWHAHAFLRTQRAAARNYGAGRSEEHTSELQS